MASKIENALLILRLELEHTEQTLHLAEMKLLSQLDETIIQNGRRPGDLIKELRELQALILTIQRDFEKSLLAKQQFLDSTKTISFNNTYMLSAAEQLHISPACMPQDNVKRLEEAQSTWNTHKAKYFRHIDESSSEFKSRDENLMVQLMKANAQQHSDLKAGKQTNTNDKNNDDDYAAVVEDDDDTDYADVNPDTDADSSALTSHLQQPSASCSQRQAVPDTAEPEQRVIRKLSDAFRETPSIRQRRPLTQVMGSTTNRNREVYDDSQDVSNFVEIQKAEFQRLPRNLRYKGSLIDLNEVYRKVWHLSQQDDKVLKVNVEDFLDPASRDLVEVLRGVGVIRNSGDYWLLTKKGEKFNETEKGRIPTRKINKENTSKWANR